ncbi:MAG: PQQ-binding-like beta-propeller repeat protein [Planctomycetales bacterium]|nr:PQQ-binding-like beta-propeller repeat protein [Planctomycetales bacterium]
MESLGWLRAALILVAWASTSSSVMAGPFSFVVQGVDRLAIVNEQGEVEWEMPWGPIHDVHLLPNGHLMVQQGAAKIVEIDPSEKKVVWSYDADVENGNRGRKVEVHSFQPLGAGRVMIAESGPARIIEINRQGKLLKEVKLQVDNPHVHHDTRLARKLTDGNYLVCHERDGVVREYDGESGEVVWEFAVPLFEHEPVDGHGLEAFGNQVFGAVRLKNGNTLVATGNGHSVLEVTPDKEVVWRLDQNDLEGVMLGWVTTLEVLPNGNYVIGNCHAGPDNPVLIEVEPKSKRLVWKYDGYGEFGNSVSNTQLREPGTLR